MDLGRFADTYWDQKDDSVDEDRLDLIISFVPKGARVLVVDGGPGMLAAKLRDRGFDVEMTDVSRHAVERARKKGLSALHVDTDDDPLPFKNRSFPCVISDSAVEHRFDPERAIRECLRVLEPGGTFLMLYPNIAHIRHRLWLLFGRFPTIKDGPSDRSHLRFLDLKETRALLKSRGARITRLRGFPSLWVKGLYPRLLRAPVIRSLYSLLTRLRPTLFARDLLLIIESSPAALAD